MATYVALLRAVNVAGNALKMADLERLVADLGGRDVTTYLRTGNVVYNGARSVADRVPAALAEELGVTAQVLVRTPKEWAEVVAGQPFDGSDNERHVTFLDGSPPATAVSAIDPSAYAPDRFRVAGREVYLLCPGGYGRSKLGNAFWERKLKVGATTRNWRTVLALAEMCGAS